LPKPLDACRTALIVAKDKKEKTEWVLVETVTTFRTRYMVEVPVGNAEWALDTVVMNEAKEFSQKHVDESIFSHRVVSKAEALALFDQDNDYLKNWDEKQKMENAFTSFEDVKKAQIP
jgi:hypothetical protein